MKLLILFSLFLLSCSKQSHWAFDQVHSDKKEFRSTKLTYYSRDPVSGLDLELLRTEEHLNAYLNIHSIPIAPYKGDPKKALVTLEINGEKIQSIAYRLGGGQRFLLSEEIAETVIEALHNHQEVSIALIGYRTLFQPEDFSAKFQKLVHPFPFENPFKLPL
ncbi:MAG: hypothetical protein JSS60_05285 [Verrucomicrobia bacterium]|nr:hypothetical protein [Verrucomicrobiota bacterium]